jgi:hypothetical protein
MKKVSVIALAVAVAIVGSVFAEEKAATEKKEVVKVEKHVLAVKDGGATVCACGAACDKCKLGEDGKTCTCGKEVSSMSCAGKFVCEKCAVVADKAGKCKCGADLVEVKAKEEVKKEEKKAETK